MLHCNMPHRSTIFRRRRRKECGQVESQNPFAGRKPPTLSFDEDLYAYTASIVGMVRKWGFIVLGDLKRFPSPPAPPGPAIFTYADKADVVTLRAMQFPAGLLAVACIDFLSLGERQIKVAPESDAALIQTSRIRQQAPHLTNLQILLKKEYPDLTEAQLKEAASDPTADWIRVITPLRNDTKNYFGKSHRRPSSRRCCPSKVIPELNRRMVSYWRKHPAFKSAQRKLRSLLEKCLEKPNRVPMLD